MADLEKAVATQLAKIEKRTGKSLEQLAGIIKASGFTKHGEIENMLKSKLGMGHGDANTLVHNPEAGGRPAGCRRGGCAARRRAGHPLRGSQGSTPAHPRAPAGGDLGFGPFEEAPRRRM